MLLDYMWEGLELGDGTSRVRRGVVRVPGR